MADRPEAPGEIDLLLACFAEVSGRIEGWQAEASKQLKGPAHEEQKAGRSVALKDFLTEELGFWSRARGAAAPLFDEAHRVVDDVCVAYLAAGTAERQKIREAAASSKRSLHLLLDHIARSAKRIQGPLDVQWLRVGLAAASINDLGTDFRDVYLALGDLYVAAARAGIDAAPQFAAVAEISSREKRFQNYSTFDFLGSFRESAFFASTVRPKLESLPRVQ